MELLRVRPEELTSEPLRPGEDGELTSEVERIRRSGDSALLTRAISMLRQQMPAVPFIPQISLSCNISATTMSGAHITPELTVFAYSHRVECALAARVTAIGKVVGLGPDNLRLI
ncbi:unnamed protein product [Heligmosomoides polygyrus]|uniref:AraC family transcriptional regulator n=1 Tax=Heligmosomoides polygyrus TaxID=6339 RepID=A0A183GHH6_HELPZ|nr:unnamed protein product [Heligmosomoides polygyrus]